MSAGPSALTVSGLSKSFGGPPVLDALDLEVAPGSLTAVLGPSGCGKTTLLRVIAGFERADSGTIRLGDRVVRDDRVHVAPEDRGIGFVAQEGALFPHLDVAANVGFGLPRAERRSARVQDLLALVGLEGLGRRYPHELSGGQQQRVALARALAPAPSLVLLDEPFDALDAGLRAQVRAEVRTVLRESGATALLVTHDQEEALSLADVVAVMRDGRIAQAADPQGLYRDPIDAQLASFLGDAVILDGRMLDGHVDTALGRIAIRSIVHSSETGTSGPTNAGDRVTVMLRPEQVLCVEPRADAPRGKVLATEFFGHDATARIALEDPSCPEITARAAGHRLPLAGDEVSLVIEGTALVYVARVDPAPRQPATATSAA